MSRLLHRLGRTTAAHPWRTISAWLLVTAAFFALAGVRTAGLVPEAVLPAATFASNMLIGAGVVAVGAKTSISGLKSMGWRPLAVLACQTALLCGLAYGAATLI